ncbi:uncharacterized protein [Chironomus tepperi]|uniref:uncharacterized protein isoform X2 n=1 Tax=Chironomus tepperi TaxID=113505 RepID=UPI00391FC9E6
MQRRKKRTTKERKKVNNCAFCKIHGEERLAKGHRGKCKYNVKEHIDKCPDCLKNQGKTIRMQKYRNNNSESKTDDSRVTSSNLEAVSVLEVNSDTKDSWIPYDDSEIPLENEEYLDNVDGAEDDADTSTWDKLTGSRTENNETLTISDPPIFTLIIMAEHYPFLILKNDYVKEFWRAIDNLPGTSTATDLRIQYKLYEKGFIKIACLDEETKDVILQLAREFTKRYPSKKIIVIHESHLLTVIKMSCILKRVKSFFTVDDEFLREIQDKNRLNTTNWFVEEAKFIPEPPDPPKQQKFYFTVDFLSAGYIHSRNFHLDIKDECVQICVRNRRELQRMYDKSLL